MATQTVRASAFQTRVAVEMFSETSCRERIARARLKTRLAAATVARPSDFGTIDGYERKREERAGTRRTTVPERRFIAVRAALLTKTEKTLLCSRAAYRATTTAVRPKTTKPTVL